MRPSRAGGSVAYVATTPAISCNITGSRTLNWTYVGFPQPNYWLIQYSPDGVGSWTNFQFVTGSTSTKSLTAGESHYVRLRPATSLFDNTGTPISNVVFYDNI